MNNKIIFLVLGMMLALNIQQPIMADSDDVKGVIAGAAVNLALFATLAGATKIGLDNISDPTTSVVLQVCSLGGSILLPTLSHKIANKVSNKDVLGTPQTYLGAINWLSCITLIRHLIGVTPSQSYENFLWFAGATYSIGTIGGCQNSK